MKSSIITMISGFNENQIPDKRKAILQPLIDFIQSKKNQNDVINLNFICTHNSRRSHFCQVWAQAMAAHFNIDKVFCYSAGTVETEIFPVVPITLQVQGFDLYMVSRGKNPVYAIKFDDNSAPVHAFSKTIGYGGNPKSNFAAVMTCDDADKKCPILPGAEKRIAINYVDPKKSDGTAKMMETYYNKSLEIGQEMWWVFKNVI